MMREGIKINLKEHLWRIMLKTAMENNTLYEPKKIVESCAMRNSDSDSNQESLQNKKFTVHDNISYLKSWFLCWKNLKDF